jgi:PAS domain S-box-containing protein/putative nucleotidyltransferase with HDIG domain
MQKAGFTADYRRVEKLDEFAEALDPAIDLILAMPDWCEICGMDSLKDMRDRSLDIPFILISGEPNTDQAVEAIRLGAADYLEEYQLARLGPAISHALEEKRLRDEKRWAEEQIRILSHLSDENPSPILRVDADGVILYANVASKPLLNQCRSGVGHPLPEHWKKHITEALETGSSPEVEVPCGQRCYSIVLSPVPIEGYVNLYGREIKTDRSSAEALRTANQAIESSINAIAIGGMDGKLTYVNPSFIRMWGYSESSEVLGRHVNEFWYLPHGSLDAAAFLLRHRNWVGEIAALRKDGTTFDAQVSASIIIGDGGQPVGHMASFLDISSRKQDAALQDAVYRIANITETTRSLDDLFQQIHQIILSVMPAENFFITLYDEKTNTLSFPYFKDELDEPYIGQLAPGKGLTAYVLRTGKSLLCTQEVHNDLERRGEVVLLGVPSSIWLGVPLITDGKTVGVMVVQHYTNPDAYGQREQHILEFVSSQAAFAITRKQAEEALRNNEQRFRALIEDTSDIVAVVNPDGIVSYVSPAVERVLGYEPGSVFGKSMYTIIHPDQMFAATEAMARRASAPGMELTPVQIRARHRDGGWRDLEVIANNLLDDPAVAGLVLTARDITERKRTEQKNLQLAAIVHASEDSIISMDMDGIILSWNKGAEKIFGYSESEVTGKPITILVPAQNDNEVRGILQRVKSGESIEHYETVRIRRDGSPIHVSVTVSPIRDLDGRVLAAAAVAHDISHHQRAEQKSRQQLERLTALTEIDRTITSSFDLRLSLGVLLTHVLKQLSVDAVDVLIFRPASQMLEFTAGRGFRSKVSEHTKLRIGESYAGRAAAERRTIHIADLKDLDDELFMTGNLAGEGFVSYYGIPLIAKGNVKGVLEIFTRKHLEPDEEWMYFLTILSEQAAIAIDNLTLFDDLQRSNSELMLAYETTLEGWSHALDLRDKETEGHTQRVVEMTVELARSLGFNDAQLVHVRRGALLHDIGKMGLPDHVLLKPDELTKEEEQQMRMHPVYAYEMLSQITYLGDALDIPYCHHEKWDGSGYPRGLKGSQIPLAARIFAVVDTWDVLTSDRSYRPAWPAQTVREHIQALSGTHFDPKVVEAFFRLFGMQ